jgi:hypothetical protein
MGLGTNRDYKTNDRRVRRNLTLLAQITSDLLNLGADPKVVDDQAYEMIIHPILYFKPLAVNALDKGVREKQFLSEVKYPELIAAARKAFRAAKAEDLGSHLRGTSRLTLED